MSVISPLESSQDEWYLAIDFGTVELCALLFNRHLGKQYPLYWYDLETQENLYRLQCCAFYSFTQKEAQKNQPNPRSSFLIGPDALIHSETEKGIFLQSLKPYLNIALSAYNPQSAQWQPKLQQSPERVLPLYWIEKATQALLTALTPHCLNMGLEVKTQGLSQAQLFQVLGNLQGVFLSYPQATAETYRFNLREAILGAKLVSQPEQIIFIEDAIACLLGHLSLSENPQQEPKPTLTIEMGANHTNLALVNLPENLQQLSHQDFTLEGFNYGGLSMDLDILYQFIYPQWVKNPQSQMIDDEIEFPPPGIPDRRKRDAVYLRLQSYPVGRALLQAAQLVKLVLQKRSEFTSYLGEQKWGVTKQQLQEKIINPYLNQINIYLNSLLAKKGQFNQEIEQVICSGGLSILVKDQLTPILEQKFSNAQIIYPDLTLEKSENQLSRNVVGLASLSLFPKLIDNLQQQYNDYFLFIELLKIIPKHIFTFEDIKEELIKRGLNFPTCERKIKEFLENQIPQGLIPSENNCLCLVEYNQNNCEYERLLTIPFCTLDHQGYYQPDVEQCQKLRQYLGRVLASHKQQLAEPLTLNLPYLKSHYETKP